MSMPCHVDNDATMPPNARMRRHHTRAMPHDPSDRCVPQPHSDSRVQRALSNRPQPLARLSVAAAVAAATVCPHAGRSRNPPLRSP
eukprot:5463794-Prymnesium_polylepis.1